MALALAVSASGPAVAAVGSWVRGDHFQLRLVAAGAKTATPAAVSGAVEISLASGWDTYWRTPGQGGSPPVLDFSRSLNVLNVAVRYPFPRRFDDGITVANVYAGGVVLPIEVTLADPARPATLALQLDIGVCKEVCIPVRARASLALPAGGRVDAEAAAIISAAEALVPASPRPGEFAVEGIARVGGPDDRPTLEVRVAVPDGEPPVLFLEGPADWYPGAPKVLRREGRIVTFSVAIDRLGSKTRITGAPMRLTLVSGDRAVEQTLHLD